MQRLSSPFPRRFLLAAVIGILSAGFLSAADPVMHAADSALPGSVLQVAVSGDPLDDAVVSLVDSRDRTISRAEGFQWRTPTGRSVSVILLGIPSTASPGDYTLVLTGDQGRADWRQEKALSIAEGSFPEQVISMSERMSTLYSDDSERKKAESRALWAVLTSFDSEAQYHFGPFLPPLPDGVPTAGFGDRRRFRMPDGSESSSVHFGSDLWAERGTTVAAAARGRVVLAAERYLTGNTVVIEHLPGVFTMYYHMDSMSVREGRMVEQGDPVGTVGDTGFATGEHLHWEMRVGATPVDPGRYLDAPLLDTNDLMSKM